MGERFTAHGYKGYMDRDHTRHFTAYKGERTEGRRAHSPDGQLGADTRQPTDTLGESTVSISLTLESAVRSV